MKLLDKLGFRRKNDSLAGSLPETSPSDQIAYPFNGQFALPLNPQKDNAPKKTNWARALVTSLAISAIAWYSFVPSQLRRDVVDYAKDCPSSLVPIYNLSHGNCGYEWHCMANTNPLCPFLATLKDNNLDVIIVANTGLGHRGEVSLRDNLEIFSYPFSSQRFEKEDVPAHRGAINRLTSGEYYGVSLGPLINNTLKNPKLTDEQKDDSIVFAVDQRDRLAKTAVYRGARVGL